MSYLIILISLKTIKKNKALFQQNHLILSQPQGIIFMSKLSKIVTNNIFSKTIKKVNVSLLMKGLLKLYILLSLCLADPDVDTRETNNPQKRSGLLFLVSIFANILFSALFDSIADRIMDDIGKKLSGPEPVEGDNIVPPPPPLPPRRPPSDEDRRAMERKMEWSRKLYEKRQNSRGSSSNSNTSSHGFSKGGGNAFARRR